MKRLLQMSWVFVFVLVVLLVWVIPIWAATNPKSQPEPAPQSQPEPQTTPTIQGYKIAFVPFKIEGGRGVAKEELPKVYREVFEKEGFNVTMGQPVEQAMQSLNIRIGGGMPTHKEMLQIGQKLGVDYVLAADIKVETRRVWVMLLPKAKSTVTIDTVIVDVKKAEVAYDPKNKIGVSQGGSGLQTAVGWVIYYPAALFMGGSLSKEEQKATNAAVKTAYADFFENLRTGQKIKIE